MRHTSIYLFSVVLALVAGCSSSARFESRSYALVNPEVESALISKLADEEFVRLGRRGIKAVQERGGKLEGLEVIDGVAVLTTTSRGHSAVKQALDKSRRDARSVAAGT